MRTSWQFKERNWQDLNICYCLVFKCNSSSSACPLVPESEHRLKMNNSSSTDEGGLPPQLQWLTSLNTDANLSLSRGIKLAFMTSKQPDFPQAHWIQCFGSTRLKAICYKLQMSGYHSLTNISTELIYYVFCFFF